MPRRRRHRAQVPAEPLTADGARTLGARIADPERRHPIVVLSRRSDGVEVLEHTALATRLGPEVEVVALADPDAAWALTNALPDGLPDVYGGAARIYRETAARIHPLVICYPDDDPEDLTRRLERHLTVAAPRTPPTSPPSTPDGNADTSPSQSQDTPSTDQAAEVATLTEENAQLIAGNDMLREELREQRQRTVRAESDATQARADLAAVRHLRRTVVYDDPEQQLRHEITQAWLRSARESERTPMREYTLGPDLLDSLKTEIIDRERVVDVIVEVLTRAVFTHPAREAHHLRVSAAGGSPTRCRPDGATAWRAALRRNTAGAPRLMWWELTDGRVEIGRAAHHDDDALR